MQALSTAGLTMNARSTQATVHIVDDEPELCSRLQRLMASTGFQTRCYASAHAFLERFEDEKLGCAIIGARLPGMSGLRLQERMVAAGATLPVVVLSPYSDLSVGVRAMKAGAVDVFPKTVSDSLLLEAVWNAVGLHARMQRAQLRRNEWHRRVGALSARQQGILSLVVAGRSTKEIAAHLDLSPKTVENHRGAIMRKLDVNGVVDLVRKVLLCTAGGDTSCRDTSPRGAADGRDIDRSRSTMAGYPVSSNLSGAAQAST